MVGLGFAEILCLLVFFVMFCSVLAIVVIAASRNRSSAAPAPVAASPFAAPPPQAAPIDYSSHADIVARLTQRFCPQCRSPLATDSPEGLCPACLMAGGMGGELVGPRNATEGVPYSAANGLAATTPPSGSKPPLDGAALAEVGDLQQNFPQLEILELLGRGGMGAVYKARQKNLDRIVALKVIPPEAAKDPTFAERFGREARALARLNHPNIVTVYDFGEIGSLHYLLMEYVDGVNLRQTLRAGRLTPREAVAIVPPICDALQYAHDQGVVHRDIKPENVLLDRLGRVKIADFGLAKLLGKGPDDFTLTRTQQVMGTPRYMAPEQIERPSTVDHRADIYSLGVVIYEMLTGELPIGRFEPPSHKVQVDVRIDQVVLRSLEKDPQRRYQRASEVKTDLASAASWPTLAAAGLPSSAQWADARRSPAGEGPGLRGNNGQSARPSWHTPTHATKSDSPFAPPGSVPLAHVLMVAFGMVLGVLLMGGGLASIVYGVIYSFRGAASAGLVWAWWGAGFGCLIGGAGSAIGSYNTYRQLAGAEDLMRSPRVTWFDWVMRGYLALGLLLLAAGMFFMDPVYNEAAGNALLLIGGIATVQAAVFHVLRTLYRIGAKPKTELTSRNPALEPLQAPGMGLLAGGIVSIAIAAIGLLVAVTFFFSISSFRTTGFGDMLVGVSFTNLAFALPTGGLMILGGLSMRRARSYSLAIAGCIAAFLPGGIAWPITLPLAIWALITLRDRRALAAFEAGSEGALAGDSGGISGAAAARHPMAGEHYARPAEPALAGDASMEAIRGQLQGPGIGLIIVGVLYLLSPLVCVAIGIVAMYGGPRYSVSPSWDEEMFITAGVLTLAIPAAILMIVGGANMRRGASYNLCQVGAIAALVPWNPGWLLSLPIGVWAILVLRRPDVRAAFEVELSAKSGPSATGERAERIAKLAPAHDVSVESIRRRVAGPAIGLMLVGIVGLLPCAAMLLTVPALVVVPSRTVQQGPSIEKIELPGSPVLVPGGAVLPPTSISLLPPALLAQREVMEPLDAMARGPLWGIVFAGAVILLSLPLSLLLIIGGWRMRQLKSYGLATIASVLAMLPCTFAWMLGLPLGLWSLIVLLQPEVREAFES